MNFVHDINHRQKLNSGQKSSNRTVIQSRELMMQVVTRTSILKEKALLLRRRVEQDTSAGREIEGKRSTTLDYIIANDSDKGLLDERSDDGVAEVSEEEAETRQRYTSCTEEYPVSDIIQTECAHNYCRECTLRLFKDSFANEALFPLRCCRLPIRVSTAVEDMLGIEMIRDARKDRSKSMTS